MKTTPSVSTNPVSIQTCARVRRARSDKLTANDRRTLSAAVRLRCCSLAFAALAVGNFVGAQTPSTVVAARLDHYNQISATQVSLVESGFAIEVDLPTTPGPLVTVKLQKPNGTTVTLARQPDETFYFDELFASSAQLVAAYPNGTYQVETTGGGADKTVAITFTGGSVPPVRITNFDTLQAISGISAMVNWEPVPAGGDEEAFLFDVGRADGTVITDTQLPGGRATSTEVYNLPAGETLIGNLAYIRINLATANGGATSIGMTDGFLVTFPLRRAAAVGAPSTPANAGAYASGLTEVTITWLPAASGEPPTGYKLERATNNAFSAGLTTFNLNTITTSYIDTTASANTTYFYRLSATNAAGVSAPTSAMQVITPGSTGSGLSSFINISSRAYCGTGNNVAIGGFVVSGDTPKRVLVRAVGPTLTSQGIGQAEVLLDPTIEVHHGIPAIATNDNWVDNPNAVELTRAAALVGASAFATGDTKSAALLLTLDPGVYSFIARGKGETSGIVLVEVYDLDAVGAGSAFVNISTRAYSTTGNGVTIGGFVIAGGASKRVLLRAVGPTLTTQGLGQTEVLTDPIIEVHKGQPVIATNDNWSDNANAASILTSGARIGALPFAAGDTKSSALLLTLPPGVYSFIAHGKLDTSGIVLVEVYDAD